MFLLYILNFRILGFRRAVPTIGRVMNMTKELKANAEKRLLKTFFVSPGFINYYSKSFDLSFKIEITLALKIFFIIK